MKRLLQIAAALTMVSAAQAQEPESQLAFAERGPRFLLAARPAPVRVDVSKTPVLRQRIALDLNAVSLHDALTQIGQASGLQLMYSAALLEGTRTVTLKADAISVASALSEVLLDAGLDVLFSPSGNAALIRRPVEARAFVGTIAGRVTEAATGNPIAQAQVSVTGARTATTREDGRYSITGVAAGTKTVTVRRLGFDPQSREVSVADGGSVTANFALAGATTRLAEIVTSVTGAQRRVEMGNAIAAINADSLTQVSPAATFGDLLQGRSAGVLSLQEGGQSGRAGRIRIRGVNSSFLSNDPVVILDGIRVEAGAGLRAIDLGSAALVAAGSGGLTGRLADLNPEEIASIEIVKGPSASTLYGTDAANGVIVITTKRGAPGKARWTVSTEQGVLHQGLDFDETFPTEYYSFGRNTTTGAQQRCTLLQQAASTCTVDSLRSFNVFTDPETTPFKDSPRREYSVQASGGVASGATYFFSVDYDHETGPYNLPAADRVYLATQRGVTQIPDWMQRPNAQRRVNLRANSTFRLSSRGSATISSSFVSNRVRQNARDGFGAYRGVGYRDNNDGWPGGALGTSTINSRPAFAFAGEGEDVVQRFVVGVVGTHATTTWLSLRGNVGADLSTNNFGYTLRREDDQLTSATPGIRRANDLAVSRYTIDGGATVSRALTDELQSRTSAGLNYNRRGQRASAVAVNTMPLGGVTVTGGTLVTNSLVEANLTNAVAGGYVEQFLGLRDRLFLTGAMRFDGASAFGESFSVAAYPKVSASWLVTEGSTGIRVPGLSSLRLRAAFGSSGVQPGATDAFSRVTILSGLNFAGTAASSGATFTAGNPDLKPERSTETEAGFDAEVWGDRVRAEVTGYHKVTTDALFSVANAPSVGGSRLTNIGEVRNRGVELVLSVEALRTTNVATGVVINGALMDNEVVQLGDGVSVTSAVAENTRLQEGYPLFGQWGRKVASYADANGNHILETSEVVLTGPESSFLGSTIPTREVTAGPYVQLFGERIHLSGLVQYRGGFRRSTQCDGTNTNRAQNDPTTPIEDQLCFVAGTSPLSSAGPGYKDGSFVLLRELSASVRLPSAVLARIRADQGTLLFAARNVAALWKASNAPIENAFVSVEGNAGANAFRGFPSPPQLFLARLTLNF